MGSGEKGTFEGQYHNVQLAVKQIVEFMKRDNCRNRIVLTHGNGPQVGATLVRHRLADDYYLVYLGRISLDDHFYWKLSQ